MKCLTRDFEGLLNSKDSQVEKILLNVEMCDREINEQLDFSSENFGLTSFVVK